MRTLPARESTFVKRITSSEEKMENLEAFRK